MPTTRAAPTHRCCSSRGPSRLCLGSAMLLACVLASAPAVAGDDHAPPAEAPAAATTKEAQRPSNAARPLGPARSASQSAPATSAAPTQHSGLGIGQTILALGVVLTLVLGCVLVLKAFLKRHQGLAAMIGAAGRAPSGLLEVLGRYPLGRGLTLILLRVDRRVLLLSQSTGRIGLRAGGNTLSTLCEITSPDDVASIISKALENDGQSITAKFGSLLERFGSGANDPAPGDPPVPDRAAPVDAAPAALAHGAGAFGTASPAATRVKRPIVAPTLPSIEIPSRAQRAQRPAVDNGALSLRARLAEMRRKGDASA